MIDDAPATGDRVHGELEARLGLGRLARYLDDDVVLDVFTAGPSIAAQEGLT